MSIWGIRCLSQKFFRRAYILASTRMQRLPVNGINRTAHNSLYQMVKKRTLEARTKLQANKYPNHQACMATPKTPAMEYECATDTCEAVAMPTYGALAAEPQFKVGYADCKNVCDAKEVLKSSECEPIMDRCRPAKKDPCEEFKRLNEKKVCGSGGAGDGKDGDGEDCDDKMKQLKLKCLLGMLAALLAGGFIAWLLSRRSKKDGEGEGSEDEAMKRAQVAGLVTTPRTSAELPKHVPYLIIGGGTAAFSAFRAIKSNDARAKVLMISNEYRKPYMRPPLSKELWYTPNANDDPIKDYRFKQWTGSERSLYFEPDEFFLDPTKLEDNDNGGIAVAQGFTVKKVDAQNRIVTLNDGYEIGYDECLIATGCSPKNLVMFSDASPSVREKVMVYRTPDDFDRLKRYAAEKRTITIIGNGFIGSELACSLAHFSKENGGGKIYQVFQEKGNMSKVLPNYLSRWTMMKMETLGVCVIPDASIKKASRDEEHLKLELNNGMTLMSDIVVVCVGCSPNTAIANSSKLEVDRSLGGFVVNAELEARRNLYVAGDASCFFDPLLGRRRVEHHDHSVVSGRLAGENMTGAKKPYTHQSMFWSDLGPDIGYEGIGLVDSSLPTVGVFALPSEADRHADNLTEMRSQEDPHPNDGHDDTLKSDGDPITCYDDERVNYGKGVIFYLKNDKIVGILLWNLFNRIGLARTIINQNKKYDDLNEVAKLFEIHA